MTLGKCVDCGGALHPYAVYEWKGAPLLRDAACPKHRTPLVQTTRPKNDARIRRERPRKGTWAR